MDNAKVFIDEIFKDEYYKIYRFQKTGIRMGDNVDLNSKNISLKIDYELVFDQKEYDKFQNRLCAFLDKIAKCKGEEEFSPSYTFSHFDETPYRELWKKTGMDKSEENNYRGIAFASIKGNKEKKIILVSYLVRKEIFELLLPKVVNKVYLVFSFLPTNESETHKAFIDATIAFGVKKAGTWSDKWIYNKKEKSYNYSDSIFFANWSYFDAKNSYVVRSNTMQTNSGRTPYKGTLTLDDVPKDYVKQLKDVYIYVLDNEEDLDEDERIKKANEIEDVFYKKK